MFPDAFQNRRRIFHAACHQASYPHYKRRCRQWVLAGGRCYTFGALSNTFEWPIIINHVWGPHETFHLMVLTGLGTHWAFILRISNGSFQ